MKRRLVSILLLSVALGTPPPAAAADRGVVVVLSSTLKPYEEALGGIRRELGGDVPALNLADGEPLLPSGVRVVIAVGGKAATRRYPGDVRLIYCLAPGIVLNPRERKSPVRIETSPRLRALVARFREIQPGLKRLAVLLSSEAVREYLADSDRVRDELGVEIVQPRLPDADELPRVLRALDGRADAIWLPPDPQLVSEGNLSTIRNFAHANRLPFYPPTAALVGPSAVAAVSCSFEEMGRTAARSAQAILSGADVPATVYPEKIQTTVNPEAAREAGLVIPAALVTAADGVVR